jgi:antitoxin component YwqK of YwqJK toxin-antitoxin module
VSFSHQKFYDTGELMSEYNEVDGKLHGKINVYWKNGNLQRVGHYANGQPDGAFTYHDEAGVEQSDDSWTAGVNNNRPYARNRGAGS